MPPKHHPTPLSGGDREALTSRPAIGRQVAVMPRTEVTLRLARKLAPRCAAAGLPCGGAVARSRTGSGGAACASRIPTYRRLQSQTHGGLKRP
jgi:hypothetical protein